MDAYQSERKSLKFAFIISVQLAKLYLFSTIFTGLCKVVEKKKTYEIKKIA